ncbi:proteasome-type protease [Elstera cyanobacteriorum]|uniref:Peptidase n=1 Tax=Elstera cyanobacteriorum TaxID=2022747 RepID=A0A255XVV5_9PROT|nr:proteasome-type protease [Elstera cyanobacteriorum]MCK6444042.1 proteasome-type protease [Elstera cyanobacteriorum]OYQ21116.1 peptidase [Elstera cyanobacteriorum]GGA01813.1 peptidase [Elstera cyanobacteriorum]
MTYCLGMRLRDGLVMVSDSRTNAGIDHISTFRKMHVWEEPGDRTILLATAGNLAISQSVVHFINEGLVLPGHDEPSTMKTVRNLFEAAQLIGEAIRTVHKIDGSRLEAKDGSGFNISCLLGGQIKGEAPRLFLIYSAGNFIEATDDTPYFQIGETKYGKPILDRALSHDLALEQAVKLALISMDSTLRSNLSVGLPLDLVLYRTDALTLALHRKIDETDPYFSTIRQQWSSSLKNAFAALSDPVWS